MRPTIGVMPLYDNERKSIWMLPGYLELVEKNGGIPLILPLTTDKEILASFFTICDGFLFTGGQDIDPSLYREKKQAVCGEQSFRRDEMECFLMKEAIAKKKPILAICRGAQLLNVLFGGTLYQDLTNDHPTAVNHQMVVPYAREQHKVSLIEGGMLHRIWQRSRLGVNSYHHQAIKDLGEGLEVTAVSTDGVIEGISLKEAAFVNGVQWHPEFFNASTPENQALMAAFYSAC